LYLHTSYKVEKIFVSGFLLVILAGAFLLWASNNFIYHMRTPFVDALFMSTSAVCVTGLATVNVGSGMGLISQLVLLLLIQIGGLGFMTGMMLMVLATGKKIGIKSRISFLWGFGMEGVHGAVKLLMMIVRYTLSVESAGAILLFIGFVLHKEPLGTAAYNALFHSVSAFCNAGFSTYPNGLNDFHLSFVVPGTIMSLIVLGGIGFPVFADCWDAARTGKRLSHYSELVITVTMWLLAAGTVLILISDWNGALAGMPLWAKVWNALFASVTTRTAGFDTISPARFSGLGQAIMIVLMVIGASPASTGGGIKTTTLGVLAIAVWDELHGRSENVFRRRKIPCTAERRALALSFVYVTTFFTGAVLLTVIDGMSFSKVLFEAVSAMGTVGLSLGITPDFSPFGKIILVMLMFWGRVGILSFFASIIPSDKGSDVHYPDTSIPIG
jgi:trk system potassium uptake protein TrkH